MTPEQWRKWLGTPEATRLINDLWPDSVMYCQSEDCHEFAASGSFCANCEAIEDELAAIRQKEVNEAQFTRYVRSAFKAS